MTYLERLKSLNAATLPTAKTERRAFFSSFSTEGGAIPRILLTDAEIEAGEERAGILEFEAGLTRDVAERMAGVANG